jgi:hypothetical protein
MLLELLPPDLPAIVLVVLHRPGDQVSYLREVLACKSGMPSGSCGDGHTASVSSVPRIALRADWTGPWKACLMRRTDG